MNTVTDGPATAWTRAAAAIVGALGWAAAGVVAFSTADDVLWHIAGAIIFAGGMLTLAGKLWTFRGGWGADAAARAGANWPQPLFIAGMFLGLAVGNAFAPLQKAGAATAVLCAIGQIVYVLRSGRSKLHG